MVLGMLQQRVTVCKRLNQPSRLPIDYMISVSSAGGRGGTQEGLGFNANPKPYTLRLTYFIWGDGGGYVLT